MNDNNKPNTKTRLIRLYRDGNTQLGFSIRGGWEHGTGIFVSEVHPGSEAAKQGLQAGDQIVRINGYSLSHAIHDDVIALVRSSPKVTLKVKSCGMIPIKDRLSDALTWKILTTTSTPPSLSSSPSPPWTSSDSHSDSDHEYIEAILYIDLKGRPLGCSVVKGPPNCPGIFVQNVKFNEPADQSGLEVGDQISHVNGADVQLMDFTEAISKLKSLPALTLTVRKGVGRHLFGLMSAPITNNTSHSPSPLDSITLHNNQMNNKLNKSADNCDKNSVNSCRVTAIVHHSVNTGTAHSRGLSTSSNGSHQSSDGSDFGCKQICDNNSDENLLNCINNNNNNNLNNNSMNILEKVKLEEQRLREERRRLEEEENRLRLEMEKLQKERKELDRRKQSDECQSLSNCSVSSASNSSSGSQSIGFLDEIKAMADRKPLLRPVNLNFNGRPNTGNKLVAPLSKCDKSNDKHKQHELLMEEFRLAHRRMFGDNEWQKSDKCSTNDTNGQPIDEKVSKETIKCVKSCPVASSPSIPKIPPPVPNKKTSTGPVVQIGTYGDNTLTNNRFAKQNHKSVIQVLRDESTDGQNGSTPQTKVDGIESPITIKVISTKQ